MTPNVKKTPLRSLFYFRLRMPRHGRTQLNFRIYCQVPGAIVGQLFVWAGIVWAMSGVVPVLAISALVCGTIANRIFLRRGRLDLAAANLKVKPDAIGVA